MRKAVLVTTLLLIAMLCLVPLGYTQASNDNTTIQDVKQETQDFISKLKGYTAEQRDEAVKQTAQALKNLDNRIDALETRIYNGWDQMDKAAREDAQISLKELRQQRVALAEWYGSLKNSSVSDWEQMKKGFSDTYTAVVDAWLKLRANIDRQ